MAVRVSLRYQRIDPTVNAYTDAVFQAYGPMRARLNPTRAELSAQFQRFPQARIEIATNRDRLGSHAFFSLPSGLSQQLSLRRIRNKILKAFGLHQARINQPRWELRVVEETPIGKPVFGSRCSVADRIVQLQRALIESQCVAHSTRIGERTSPLARDTPRPGPTQPPLAVSDR